MSSNGDHSSHDQHDDGLANGRNNRVFLLVGVLVLFVVVLGVMALIGEWQL